MADAAVNRLLPCLLDRLSDDQPEAAKESADRRTISMGLYRQGVRRDLENLLNASCRPVGDEFDQYENVRTSVLNFGVPDLSGQMLSGLGLGDLERRIRQAMIRYEPRIIARTLKVHVASSTTPNGGRHSLTMEITGELWASPMPDPLYYRTEVDLESGQFQIKDRTHG